MKKSIAISFANSKWSKESNDNDEENDKIRFEGEI